jgi:hypothetical protein
MYFTRTSWSFEIKVITSLASTNTNVNMVANENENIVPLQTLPSAKEKRYDRQLRLWVRWMMED